MKDSPFFKLSGGGNDFIAFVDPRRDPEPAEIRAICRRGVSLGADGVFVLRSTASGVRMDYWNADGRLAELCLNGTRCAARLARHLGWCRGQVTILTASGEVKARLLGDESIVLDVPAPVSAPRSVEVAVTDETSATLKGWALEVGVPHFVLHWPANLADAPVETLGKKLRSSDEFAPAGTNVMFARFPARNRLEVRSFERGVEAETLACGTGMLAATAVGVRLGELDLPVDVDTLGGFPFAVSGRAEEGRVVEWSLTGDARLLAEGELRSAAMAAAKAPRWSE